MADIFISYANEDIDRVVPLAKALENQGWSVFWDRKIPPGRTWDDIIEEAIEAAKCIIVVWTKESVNSGWVRAEAQEGLDREILVPVKFEEVKIPLRFRSVQAANFIGWEENTSNTGFKNLRDAITDILGSPPPVNERKRRRKEEEARLRAKKELKKKKTEAKYRETATIEPKSPESTKKSNALKFGALAVACVIVLLIFGILWVSESQKKKKLQEFESKIERIFEKIAFLEQSVDKIERPEQLDELYGKIDSLNQQAVTLGEQPAKFGLGSKLKEISKRLERVKSQFTNKVTKNSIGMEFVLIQAGSFTMGSSSEIGNDNEHPAHIVEISRPFHLQKTEVTQGQWKKVMGYNPSAFKECGVDCSVEKVSWEDAYQFINKLNEMEGVEIYRLPTETEWEYAVRAGSTTEYFFGDNASKLGEYAWYRKNSKGKTHTVGQKKPNDWGLYDMYGNVWEWVEDDWHEDYNGAPDDGRAWMDEPRKDNRVIRGGFWGEEANVCRSAFRFPDAPYDRDGAVGFRLVRSVALGP